MTITHANGCSVNGTWADYVVGWTDYVQPIPESLESAAATPILCAGITVYKAIKQSNANIGDWIAISGAGGGLGFYFFYFKVRLANPRSKVFLT
jgi:alcohol dehydrogenase, propanol-preferring